MERPMVGGEFLPEPLVSLVHTAQREINGHVNELGLCAICGSAFPCERGFARGVSFGRVVDRCGKWGMGDKQGGEGVDAE